MLPYVRGEKFKLPEDRKEAGFSEGVTKDTYAIDEADSSFEHYEVMYGDAINTTNLVLTVW
jgi:hypothetical protein